MKLKQLNTKSIALVIRHDACHDSHRSKPDRIIRGVAQYVIESKIGEHLKINLAESNPNEEGSPSLVLQGDEWGDRFLPGHDLGCDYQLEMPVSSSV
ncbi:MAG: hypothetical protein COA78_37095 [Blastopirellula sp.]|nr:MAG: hypothetical protein COA78_37095 [Blastopirellula sp.]